MLVRNTSAVSMSASARVAALARSRGRARRCACARLSSSNGGLVGRSPPSMRWNVRAGSPVRRFDLDDVGAPVGEDSTGRGSGDPHADLDNTYAGQRSVRCSSRRHHSDSCRPLVFRSPTILTEQMRDGVESRSVCSEPSGRDSSGHREGSRERRRPALRRAPDGAGRHRRHAAGGRPGSTREPRSASATRTTSSARGALHEGRRRERSRSEPNRSRSRAPNRCPSSD